MEKDGKELIGKKLRIVFDDLGSAHSKIGTCISENENFITLQTDLRTEIISLGKIIRMEIMRE